LLDHVLKDQATPRATRAKILGALGDLSAPVDVVPDFTAATGTELLKDVLLARGASAVANWAPASAFDISPDGSVILGTARPLVGFATQWFIATIDWSLGTECCGPAVPNSTGASSELTARSRCRSTSRAPRRRRASCRSPRARRGASRPGTATQSAALRRRTSPLAARRHSSSRSRPTSGPTPQQLDALIAATRARRLSVLGDLVHHAREVVDLPVMPVD